MSSPQSLGAFRRTASRDKSLSKKPSPLCCKNRSMSVRTSQEIVKQIEQERDSCKIAELAQKPNDAMLPEEKEKVKRRVGISPDRSEMAIFTN